MQRKKCRGKEEIQHRGVEKETNTSRDRKIERRKGRKMGVNCGLTNRKKKKSEKEQSKTDAAEERK